MVRLAIIVGLSLGLSGCMTRPMEHRSANPYEPSRTGGRPGGGAGEAGGSVALAAGMSVKRRLEGGCYVACLRGTVCNEKTGLCDTLPCRGVCRKNERCDETGVLPKCVPDPGIDLQIETTVPSSSP